MRRYTILIKAVIFIGTISLSACFILKPLPVPAPNIPIPTDNSSKTPPIDTTTKTLPEPTKPLDPDNLNVYFVKPASEVYLAEFGGTARAHAKTHPSKAKTKYRNSVGEVLKNLPTDSYMRRIGVSDTSHRTPDEEYNIFIKKAYLFFISKETDQDFHLIIGDIDSLGVKSNFMTVEIAGLPKGKKDTPAYKILERTRRQLYEKFPDFFEGNKKTFKPQTQFPEIAIRGSLFFDNHHSAGQIGSGDAKPNTVWEIHPVTFIEFK
jgi:hypothetical protein